MGYNTDFEGTIDIFPSLTPAQAGEINRFCEQRHHQLGNQNREAGYAPSLHCDWETDGMSIFWNGTEKSYSMFEWLQELDRRFFKPWGCTLEGEIVAQGDRVGDVWAIRASEGSIRKIPGRMKFEEAT